MIIADTSDAGVHTIRPGRSVFVRQEHLGRTEDDLGFQLVFQHGTMGTENHYECLLKVLQQRCGEFLNETRVKCIFYDSSGCGQSPPPVDSSSRAFHNEELAKDFAAIVDLFTDSTIPMIFIGHSYGPTIVLNYLQQTNPLISNVKAVIFISTAIRNPHLPHADGGHPIMKLPLFLLRFLQTKMTEEFVKMAVHSEHSTLRDEMRLSNNHNDMAVARKYHRNMQWATVDDIDILRNVPSLIIHGKDDGVIPLACGQHLADQLPKSTFVVVNQASHLVMIEQPEQVGEEILRFISTIM